MALLPSPRTSDTNGAGHHGDGGMDLRTAVAEIPLLPTPAVNDMGAAYTPETWDEWTATMKAKHNNGNGHGKSLNVEAQRMRVWVDAEDPDAAPGDGYWTTTDRLLPTPTGRDPKGANQRGDDTCLAGAKTSDRAREEFGSSDSMQDVVEKAAWGEYEPAIRRWERLTRPAPEPTKPNAKGNPKLSDEFDEWLMGLPAGWVTDVPGITWNEVLKACGNGVVPQQCAEALRWLRVMAEWRAVA